jgi:hypothetical protein
LQRAVPFAVLTPGGQSETFVYTLKISLKLGMKLEVLLEMVGSTSSATQTKSLLRKKTYDLSFEVAHD